MCNPRCILWLILVLCCAFPCNGLDNRTLHPNISISWEGPISSKKVPPMKIRYMQDKKTKKVILKRRSPFGEIPILSDLCSFKGIMEGTPHTSVTVSGCPDEEYQVMVHTRGKRAMLATVDGGVTYITPIIDRSSHDVVVKDKKDMEHLSNGAGYGKRSVPKKLKIRLAVAIDETFKDFFDNDIDKSVKTINQIMLHTEGLFNDESLGTVIEFQEMVLYDHSEVSSIGAASEEHLSALGPYAEEYNKAAFFSHFVLFSYDASGDDIVGMSYIGKICSEDSSSRISITEYDKSPVHTAMIFAHELGHNLGLAHDAGICVGIMYPLIIGAEEWSDCSKLQLKGYYNNVLNRVPFFCLEEGSGTWSKWSDWSECDFKCKKTKKRICEKNICTGKSIMTKPCKDCDPSEEETDEDIEDYENELEKLDISLEINSANEKKEKKAVEKASFSDSNRWINLLFGFDTPDNEKNDILSKFFMLNNSTSTKSPAKNN